MKISEIAKYPTAIRCYGDATHESVLRSYQVVQKVRDLLSLNTPAAVVLELIDEMMDSPQTELVR